MPDIRKTSRIVRLDGPVKADSDGDGLSPEDLVLGRSEEWKKRMAKLREHYLTRDMSALARRHGAGGEREEWIRAVADTARPPSAR